MRLADLYDITGYFYSRYNLEDSRMYLNIKRKKSKENKPDLIVVMMNPGASYPIKYVERAEVETEPDKTQEQIMQVMYNCKLEYARIFNLSDIRQSKSKCFYSFVKYQDDNTHSIFDSNRSDEFELHFETNAHVIVAWGVNYHLKDLAKSATDKLNLHNIQFIGKAHKQLNAYYHPLPRYAKERKEWVEYITKEIKSRIIKKTNLPRPPKGDKILE